jgi:hypothetical protein
MTLVVFAGIATFGMAPGKYWMLCSEPTVRVQLDLLKAVMRSP